MKTRNIIGFAIAALAGAIQPATAQQPGAVHLTAVVQAPSQKLGTVELVGADGENYQYKQKGTDTILAQPVSACKVFYIMTPADLASALTDYRSGELADARKALMNKVMWDEKAGMFCDHNYIKDTKSPFVSVAQFYPLFTGLATKEQAAKTVKLLPKLEHHYGVAGCQSDGLLDFQWDYPHGWACHQYIMVNALLGYGYREEALRIARKYVSVVDKVFAETGALWEKYDVVKGEVSVTKEYESPKMLGWSAGVYLFCRNLIGK